MPHKLDPNRYYNSRSKSGPGSNSNELVTSHFLVVLNGSLIIRLSLVSYPEYPIVRGVFRGYNQGNLGLADRIGKHFSNHRQWS